MRLLSLFLICLSSQAIAESPGDQKFKAISAREYAWARADGGGGEDNDRVTPHLQDVRPAAQAKRSSRAAGARWPTASG